MSGRYNASSTLERVFPSPIEDVWAMWTTAEGIESWHGPKGFATKVLRLELRIGGAYDFEMIATDPQMIAGMQAKGRPTSWVTRTTFTEIVQHQRLAYEAAMEMGPGQVAYMLHTVVLEPVEGGVRLTLTIEATSDGMIQGAMRGWAATLDALLARLVDGRPG